MVKLLVAAGADRTARDAQYDGTPQGWAETSIEVSNNPKCADVVAYSTRSLECEGHLDFDLDGDGLLVFVPGAKSHCFRAFTASLSRP